MTATLTTASSLSCPHGGTVSISSSNATTDAAGSKIVTISDTFTISGCAFTLPGPKPSPCVRVQWVVPDVRVRVGGVPTLSQTSVGVCISADSIPQGPVVVSSTQPKVVST
jgi:hypothetical protein